MPARRTALFATLAILLAGCAAPGDGRTQVATGADEDEEAVVAPESPVRLNELALRDAPQAFVEIVNVGEEAVDLSGGCLVANDGTEWHFPSGTIVEPGSFLVVWFSEAGEGAEGIHAERESLLANDRREFGQLLLVLGGRLVDGVFWYSEQPEQRAVLARVGTTGVGAWKDIPAESASPGEENPPHDGMGHVNAVTSSAETLSEYRPVLLPPDCAIPRERDSNEGAAYCPNLLRIDVSGTETRTTVSEFTGICAGLPIIETTYTLHAQVPVLTADHVQDLWKTPESGVARGEAARNGTFCSNECGDGATLCEVRCSWDGVLEIDVSAAASGDMVTVTFAPDRERSDYTGNECNAYGSPTGHGALSSLPISTRLRVDDTGVASETYVESTEPPFCAGCTLDARLDVRLELERPPPRGSASCAPRAFRECWLIHVDDNVTVSEHSKPFMPGGIGTGGTWTVRNNFTVNGSIAPGDDAAIFGAVANVRSGEIAWQTQTLDVQARCSTSAGPSHPFLVGHIGRAGETLTLEFGHHSTGWVDWDLAVHPEVPCYKLGHVPIYLAHASRWETAIDIPIVGDVARAVVPLAVTPHEGCEMIDRYCTTVEGTVSVTAYRTHGALDHDCSHGIRAREDPAQ